MIQPGVSITLNDDSCYLLHEDEWERIKIAYEFKPNEVSYYKTPWGGVLGLRGNLIHHIFLAPPDYCEARDEHDKLQALG